MYFIAPAQLHPAEVPQGWGASKKTEGTMSDNIIADITVEAVCARLLEVAAEQHAAVAAGDTERLTRADRHRDILDAELLRTLEVEKGIDAAKRHGSDARRAAEWSAEHDAALGPDLAARLAPRRRSR